MLYEFDTAQDLGQRQTKTCSNYRKLRLQAEPSETTRQETARRQKERSIELQGMQILFAYHATNQPSTYISALEELIRTSSDTKMARCIELANDPVGFDSWGGSSICSIVS